MILAIDVQHGEGSAIAAGVLFSRCDSEVTEGDRPQSIGAIAPYEPGSFYKRELPCILSLLEEITANLDAIIVDGYVTLGPENKPGLGMRLYEQIERNIPVVGVAKNRFKDTLEVCEVLHGNSQKPLLVTAVGTPLNISKLHIVQMHGKHRLPTLLKRVDQLCRGIIEPS